MADLDLAAPRMHNAAHEFLCCLERLKNTVKTYRGPNRTSVQNFKTREANASKYYTML